jgi:hypothetical protein
MSDEAFAFRSEEVVTRLKPSDSYSLMATTCVATVKRRLLLAWLGVGTRWRGQPEFNRGAVAQRPNAPASTGPYGTRRAAVHV